MCGWGFFSFSLSFLNKYNGRLFMKADASEQAKQEKVKVLINFKCHICMRWFMEYNTKTKNKDDLDSF